MRNLIKAADPDVIEEWKWMGTPVWSHDGILCTGESYKDKVKLTFAKGASLKDPTHFFNASLEGNVRRAIDIVEGAVVDECACTGVGVGVDQPGDDQRVRAVDHIISRLGEGTRRADGIDLVPDDSNVCSIKTLVVSVHGENGTAAQNSQVLRRLKMGHGVAFGGLALPATITIFRKH